MHNAKSSSYRPHSQLTKNPSDMLSSQRQSGSMLLLNSLCPNICETTFKFPKNITQTPGQKPATSSSAVCAHEHGRDPTPMQAFHFPALL